MLQYNVLHIKHITGERGSMLNFIRGFCMALADSVPGVSCLLYTSDAADD